MRASPFVCALLALFLPGSAPVHAQSTQGILLGRVTDSTTSLGVAGARVECINSETRQTLSTTTGAFGLYSVPSLSPGTYAVTITENKYQSQQARSVEVRVASRVELNFRLRPLSDLWEAGRSDLFRIPGTTRTLGFYGPDVDTSRLAVFTANTATASPLETSLSYVVDPVAIDDLPLTGRDVYTMLLLLPGVTADTGTARGLGFAAFGQRPSSSDYLLDGADNNFLLATGPLNAPPPEFIQEYRVSTGDYTAEFGRTSGFVANAVTRGATNNWHIGGFFHLENQLLNANDFQANAGGLARQPMTQVEGGFVGGGPLIPRRLFLSGGLDVLRTKALADPQPFALPTASFVQSVSPASYAGALFRAFPLPLAPQSQGNAGLVQIAPEADFSRADEYARLDWLATPADRILLRFLRDTIDQPEFLYSPYPGFSTPLHQASISGAGSWTRQIGARLQNEFRAARSGDAVRFIAPNSGVPELSLFANADITVGAQTYPVVLPGPQNPYNYRNRGTSYDAGDTLTGIAGRHLWKTGAGFFQRNITLNLAFDPGGALLFPGFSQLAAGIPQQLLVEIDRYAAGYAPVEPDRNYRYRQAYLFAQDSFRLTNRITLDFGLRYEWYGSPINTGSIKDTLIDFGSGANIIASLAGAAAVTPASGADQTVYSTAGLNLAPRFGIAWDITGSGRTTLRASYGLFYDRPFDNLWENTIQNRYLTVGFQNFTAPLAPGASTPAVEAAGTFEPSSQEVDQLAFQPGLRAPRIQNAFAGIQHALRSTLSLEADTRFSRGRGLITTDIINRPLSLDPSTSPSGYINPTLGQLDYRANQGDSQYVAFTTTARFSRRNLLAQASFTWSHAEDNQSDPLANAFFNLNQFQSQQSLLPFRSAFTQQFNNNADWADSDFDQRLNFVAYGTWSPFLRALRNWTVSGLVAARSGLPFSVYAIQTTGFIGDNIVNERADLLNPAQAMSSAAGPGGRFLLNPAAFALPSSTVGTSGRNEFNGPGLFNSDVSFARAFRLPLPRESALLTLRADAYNFLNHANLNNPSPMNLALGSPDFGLAQRGRIETASGFPLIQPLHESARVVQILLRLDF